MMFRKASNYFECDEDEVEDSHEASLATAPGARRLEEIEADDYPLGAFRQRNSDALYHLYMSQLPPDKQA